MTLLPHFSHIYLEDDAADYETTRTLLSKYAKATIVPIQSYKEVFNRPRQRWDHQRLSLSLIIARRRDNFLYGESRYVPGLDGRRFYYNTTVLNCLYGCEYCYLQGMFASPNIVVFANVDDFTAAAREAAESGPMYLCISYDTDLLAFENMLGYCRTWIRFAEQEPNAMIEIRTKSANFRAIADMPPSDRVILAWTVSPESIVEMHESKTARLDARLNAMHEAIRAGWNVRLCIDPILHTPTWEQQYEALVGEIFSKIDGNALYDVTLGVFRINSKYLRSMQEANPASTLLHGPLQVSNGAAAYPNESAARMLDFVSARIAHHVPLAKIRPIASPVS